jgi:phosphohistidine phosphatase SixA
VETMACLQEAVLNACKASLPFTIWEGLLPEGDAVEADAWLRKRVEEMQGKGTLAITSHQPFLGELIYWLTGENYEIRKASCTIVERKGGKWRFRKHFRPSELREKA